MIKFILLSTVCLLSAPLLYCQSPGYFECGGLTYLPDGSGQQYVVSININGFNGQVINNESDLSKVSLIMEHSFLGDLETWLECPSGATSTIFDAFNQGAIPGGISGGGVFLGHPYDDAGGGGAGLGMEYDFSSSFNSIQGSLTQNLSNTIPVASIPNNIPPLTSGNTMNPYDTYQPESSFSNFIGCPIDGQWTLYIQDNLGIDDGYIFNWKLYFDPVLIGCSGRVFNDLNYDCIQNFPELGVEGINLIIQPGNYIVETDIMGAWFIDSLPDGVYSATVDTTNLNWSPTCSVTQSFTIDNLNNISQGPDFGLTNNSPCSDPNISIYANNIRRCFQDQMIYVQACNQNTATGVLNASYVDVELDPLITVNSASLPFTSLPNNIYRFQTGDLSPGQCANFNLSTTVSCNANLGQTLCMEATLFPAESCALDTVPSNPPAGGGGGTGGTLDGLPQPCTLPWDQSSLSVDGWCQNDTIYFTITNTGDPGGGDMECYSPLWVTVDGVVTFTDSIMIPGGQTLTYSFPGDGATWILNAEQHPLHPGNSHPNAHVEACGDANNWTPGLVNELPLDDADPVVDIYCGVVTGSFDPNDKTGYPLGQTEEHFIQPNQQLQYVIRFQNTGTDTAFTVVIRDTLDTDLNIFTVTPGVSSHDYNFQMYGPRVLEWTFNNINLPDSTTDMEGSNGFVTFQVEQVPNLAPGTEITNDADIYFDFNDPITTNTTFHRIFEGFISVAALEEQAQKESKIIVYPNPSNGSFTIDYPDSKQQEYIIYNQLGKCVQKGILKGEQTPVTLYTENGMYFLQIDNHVVKFNVNNISK